jgi:pantetheine-phosphate adenylyltransferase
MLTTAARPASHFAGFSEAGSSHVARTAIYPGSFDPLTRGHVTIIDRGLRVFDEITIAVATNPGKNAAFSMDERIEMVREVFEHEPRILVATFSGLLVNYARECGAAAILRGLRAVSDFEYEYQMASMNRSLAPDIETVFLMAEPDAFFVSSRLVKEVASLGGDVSASVPASVNKRILQRFPRS